MSPPTRRSPANEPGPDEIASKQIRPHPTTDLFGEALTDDDLDRAAEEFVQRHGAGYAGRVATALLCAGALAQHEEVTSC